LTRAAVHDHDSASQENPEDRPIPRYYPALDGLRGVAAMCIVLMHRNIWFGLWGWLAHGYLAVDFFFMLSGFVIASAYEQKLRDGMTAVAFLRARFVRLYPMLLLGAALGALWEVIALTTHPGATTPPEIAWLLLRAILITPTLTPNSVGVGVFPLDPPIWSLFFELVINLVYVATLRWMTTVRLALVLVASLAALAMLALRRAGVDVGGSPEVFWGGFARVSFPFFSGVMLHRLRDLGALARVRFPFWLQALVLVIVFNIPSVGRSGAGLDLACVGIVFPLVLIAGMTTTARRPVLARLRLMGEFSYPAYVLHYPLYVLLGGIGYGLGVLTPQTMFAFGLGCLAVVMAASHFAVVFYDRPLRSWLSGARMTRTPGDLATGA
jgi:peptidoglycan/LPS O-acetylase OafA/YrhL